MPEDCIYLDEILDILWIEHTYSNIDYMNSTYLYLVYVRKSAEQNLLKKETI